jgi:cob(I)alamin adenosyltransferase
MTKFYTQTGDDGYTGVLGEGRLPKHDARMEALGDLDEASAALGMVRAGCTFLETYDLVLKIQRDLYNIMTEISATPENAARFRKISAEQITWLEQKTDQLSEQVQIPKEFILPGDSPRGAVVSLARTIVRRAERHVSFLLLTQQIESTELLRYLNRLSSFLFVLELWENQVSGKPSPTLARK